MPTLPKRTGVEERAFMRWALTKILVADNHPLLFLVDPSTKDWRSNLGSRDHRSTNEHNPAVQAGHLYTRRALNDIDDQRFALEDADQNLEANYRIERPGIGGIVDRPAVDIMGGAVNAGDCDDVGEVGFAEASSPGQWQVGTKEQAL
jgi:hypothetical protein